MYYEKILILFLSVLMLLPAGCSEAPLTANEDEIILSVDVSDSYEDGFELERVL